MRFLAMALLLFLSSFAFSVADADASHVDRDVLSSRASGVLIPFVENDGRVADSSVMFFANTFAGTISVKDNGELVYDLAVTENSRQGAKRVVLKEILDCPEPLDIKGTNRSRTKVNYLVGQKEKWVTGLSTWQEVSLGRVYRGIDMGLRANGKNIEKIFTVHPEGDVHDIRIEPAGAVAMSVNRNGELEVVTPEGTVTFTRPVAYQEGTDNDLRPNGIRGRQYVEAAYVVNGRTYGFHIEDYDRTMPLVIDPLLSSTFLGGSVWDYARAVTAGPGGDVYVTGWTYSSNLPATAGAADQTHNGQYDVFVAKLDAGLTELLALTFLGGTLSDYANTIAVDPVAGSVYVAGETYSSDFPVTSLAYDLTHAPAPTNYDAFVSKLSSDLATLTASTFLGGRVDEHAYSIALAQQGDIYVTGLTRSSDFPVITGNFDTGFNGVDFDAFVSRLDGNLSTLRSSTFLGGTSSDYANTVTFDMNGNVLVAGVTNSPDFPVTFGAYDTAFNDTTNYDGFISKLDSGLMTLQASTFLGGAGTDEIDSIAATPGGIYAAGSTASTNFPAVSGSWDTRHNGGQDGFISRFTSGLDALTSSTFLGGEDFDKVNAMAVDQFGNVYVTGLTHSSGFPVTSGSYDTSYNGGGFNTFVTRLSGDLTSMPASTYFGEFNEAYSIALGQAGQVYIAGYTTVSTFPVTDNAYRVYFNGRIDAFISMFDSDLAVDNDNDGYGPPDDCDDSDPSVHPGAVEIPDNGIDEDCDGFDLSGADADGDGVPDPDDNCADVMNPDQADSDLDGVGDACDNCREAHNPDQMDSNSSEDDNSSVGGVQHYGDICDPDFDNNGVVGLEDFNELRTYFRQAVPPAPAYIDIDGSGYIDLGDFNVLRLYFRKAPGPGIE